jgi:hypothetical protein
MSPIVSSAREQKLAIAAVHERAGAPNEITDARAEFPVCMPFLGYNIGSEKHHSNFTL